MSQPATAYPVVLTVQPAISERDRLTVFFRLILAIPHLLLVGGAGWIFTGQGFGFGIPTVPSNAFVTGSIAVGALGAAVYITTVFAWFAIVFTGKMPQGLESFAMFYLRWRARAIAYLSLFRDEYPPFGDGEASYPVSITVDGPPPKRDRVSVGFRFILIIPHWIVLFFLGFAAGIVGVIAWFAILFTGTYPQGLYNFAVGVVRWTLRVEAYLLLLVDEYPPFSMD